MSEPHELIDLQERIYASSNPTRRWLHNARKSWITETIARCSPAAREKAIEVGIGSGLYLPLLSAAFDDVVGFDIETAYIDHARQRYAAESRIGLVQGDILRSALRPDSFDLALCTEVIEHIADSQQVLVAICKALKPGGILILSTPQRWSPLELVAKIAFLPGVIDVVRKIYNEPIIKTGHINLMTAGTVERQLNRAGFTILERYKSGVYIPLVAEFLGNRGLAMQRWLEKKLRGTPLDALFWTQYYLVKKEPGDE